MRVLITIDVIGTASLLNNERIDSRIKLLLLDAKEFTEEELTQECNAYAKDSL